MKHSREEALNLLDLDQWQFWVVSGRKLDAHALNRDSIALAPLGRRAGPAVSFSELAAAVAAEAGEGRSGPAPDD